MNTTTVELDATLLSQIVELKPHDQTLSDYVRDALQRDVRHQQRRQSAETYRSLLRDDITERRMMEEWESAPLSVDPTIDRS